MTPSYTVYIKSGAEKELKLLPRDYQKAITEAILSLGSNPRPLGSRKLTGKDNHYRVRVGRYRVVYKVQDKKLIVLVIRIGARKDVYRKL